MPSSKHYAYKKRDWNPLREQWKAQRISVKVKICKWAGITIPKDPDYYGPPEYIRFLQNRFRLRHYDLLITEPTDEEITLFEMLDGPHGYAVFRAKCAIEGIQLNGGK